MAIGGIVAFGLDPDFSMIPVTFALGAMAGSFMPDCDIVTAPAGWIVPAWLVTKHRRHTHSLFMAGVFSIIPALYNPWFGAGFLLGYLLHLLGDRMTAMGIKMGIPYLLWYPGKKIRRSK